MAQKLQKQAVSVLSKYDNIDRNAQYLPRKLTLPRFKKFEPYSTMGCKMKPEPSKKNILCCDDDRELCDLMAEELESIGYRVFRCYSGNQAIQFLGYLKVDLVLSDFKMPDGDGMLLLKIIRDTDSDHPIVFMMTGSNEISEKQWLNAGAQRLFYKPVSMSNLVTAIQWHLTGGR